MSNTILKLTARQSGVSPERTAAVLHLANEESCTVPFIARYRKERTGGLDEVAIQNIIDIYETIQKRESRRDYVLRTLKEQSNLTPEREKALRKAETTARIEDIFLPFRPRRKTRADKAVEAGLKPLAEQAREFALPIKAVRERASAYTGDTVPDITTAVNGAADILAQRMADTPDVRETARRTLRSGLIVCRVKRGKKKSDGASAYRDYFDHTEPLSRVKAHRVMAMFRGEQQGILNVTLTPSDGNTPHGERILTVCGFPSSDFLLAAADDAWNRILMKSIGREIKKEVGADAERESLRYFRKNLEDILMSAPFGERMVIGIDPGIRTGCKAVLVDETGSPMDYMTIFLNQDEQNVSSLRGWIDEHPVAGIAVGSGTFGRETRRIVRDLLLGQSPKDIVLSLVDEDGASVYSASETARRELPGLDIIIRGAVSIARRFQDPLAELVKIDPRSLGVGQYQHDIDEKLLADGLDETVEWAVNRVGVNVNTASPDLLRHVSGLDTKKSAAIIAHRKEIGRFSHRDELLSVSGIGPKSYEQAAGFVRIVDGREPLDATGVHPESYDDVRRMAAYFNTTISALVSGTADIDLRSYPRRSDVSEFTSVVEELQKSGVDPRSSFIDRSYTDAVTSLDDLREGMELTGYVNNVVAFGAFVDIGLKQDGLVHISEIADRYVERVSDVLSVGQEVSVKIIDIDHSRNRISLSIRKAGTDY